MSESIGPGERPRGPVLSVTCKSGNGLQGYLYMDAWITCLELEKAKTKQKIQEGKSTRVQVKDDVIRYEDKDHLEQWATPGRFVRLSGFEKKSRPGSNQKIYHNGKSIKDLLEKKIVRLEPPIGCTCSECGGSTSAPVLAPSLDPTPAPTRAPREKKRVQKENDESKSSSDSESSDDATQDPDWGEGKPPPIKVAKVDATLKVSKERSEQVSKKPNPTTVKGKSALRMSSSKVIGDQNVGVGDQGASDGDQDASVSHQDVIYLSDDETEDCTPNTACSEPPAIGVSDKTAKPAEKSAQEPITIRRITPQTATSERGHMDKYISRPNEKLDGRMNAVQTENRETLTKLSDCVASVATANEKNLASLVKTVNEIKEALAQHAQSMQGVMKTQELMGKALTVALSNQTLTLSNQAKLVEGQDRNRRIVGPQGAGDAHGNVEIGMQPVGSSFQGTGESEVQLENNMLPVASGSQGAGESVGESEVKSKNQMQPVASSSQGASESVGELEVKSENQMQPVASSSQGASESVGESEVKSENQMQPVASGSQGSNNSDIYEEMALKVTESGFHITVRK